MGGDDIKEKLANIPALKPEHIAEAVVYVLGTPPIVQVRINFFLNCTQIVCCFRLAS